MAKRPNQRIPQTKKLLIVDGYNVLRSGGRYRAFLERMPDYGDESFNAARDALVNDVVNFAGHEYRSVVVFDGGNNAFSDGRSTLMGGVEVVFSAAGETADSVIEEQAKAAVERGLEVLVVTSDAATQWTVLGNHVSRMSADGFYTEMESLSVEREQDNSQDSHVKYALGDRIDPEKLRRLKRLLG
ncbi:MAG: NYN domain-containing protein [Actinomycetia bacterium]|nr:NYN domain-containing protein [Actinomycetes bacterium]